MSPLERGFKTWSEKLAAGVRRDLGLASTAPLPPQLLADYLDVRVWTPRQVPGLPQAVCDQLLERDPGGWSAVTQTVAGKVTVIYNPRHSLGRRNSDITHELAHVLLEHAPSKLILSPDGRVVMRTFDGRQEDEAGWLSGCLLLPRVALMHSVRTGMDNKAIATEFQTSEVLVRYRVGITGVASQLRRLRATRPG
jgi:hypothetical protein